MHKCKTKKFLNLQNLKIKISRNNQILPKLRKKEKISNLRKKWLKRKKKKKKNC